MVSVCGGDRVETKIGLGLSSDGDLGSLAAAALEKFQAQHPDRLVCEHYTQGGYLVIHHTPRR